MTKKELYQKRNEKWRIASQKIVDLRYNLEDILHSFDEEEKRSERYRQLLDSIRQQLTYVLGDGLKHQHIRNEIARVVDRIHNHEIEQEDIEELNDSRIKHLTKTTTAFVEKMKLKIHYLLIAVIGAVLLKFFETLPLIFQILSGKGG